MRSALNLVTALVLLAIPQAGRAQDFAVVPVLRPGQTIGDLKGLRVDTQRILADQHLAYVEPDRAARVFRESVQGSKEPGVVSAEELSDFNRLTSETSQGQKPRSSIAPEIVLGDMDQLRAMLERAPEVFNVLERKPATLGACIGAVSVLLNVQRRDDARELAAWCLYVLDYDMKPKRVPELLMPLFHEADQLLLERERAGALRVKVVPDTCVPFVNGDSESGRKVRARRRYRVHAVCPDGTRSRMHDVALWAGETQVDLEVHFDAAVHTDAQGLYLEEPDAEREHGHLLSILRALKLQHVFAISREGGRYRVRHVVEGAGQMLDLPDPYTRAQLASVLDRLLEPTAEATVLLSASAGDAGSSLDAQSKQQSHHGGAPWGRRLRLGVAGAAITLGAGSVAAAAAFTVKRHDAGLRLRASNEGTLSLRLGQWHDTRAKPYAFSAFGALALTSGVVGLLLSQEGKSFPSWAVGLVGVAGVGLAAWGVVDIARGSPCEGSQIAQRACSQGLERRDVGALELFAAVPLLAVPITQLIVRLLEPVWPGKTVTLTPQANPLQKTLYLDARVHWL